MKHLHSLVDDLWGISEMVEVIKTKSLIGFDIETTGLDWWNPAEKIVGMGFGYLRKDSVRTYYLPINHVPPFRCFNESKAFALIHEVLEDSRIAKVGANIKFDAHFAEAQGLEINNLHDVQVMARLVRSDFIKVGLKVLCKKEFKAEHTSEIALKKWAKANGVNMSKVSMEPGAMGKCDSLVVGRYCGEDVYWTLRLCKLYSEMINKDSKLVSLYKNIEQPLIKATMAMEKEGIGIDIPYLEGCRDRLTKLYNELETKIYDIAGRKFNLDSIVDARKFFVDLGIEPEMRRRKKGDATIETASIDKKVLEKHKEKPVIDAILKFRAVSKILNTYVLAMLKSGKNVIHTSIAQESARTGRLSALNPNLMNLPKTAELTDSEIDRIKKANSIRRAIISKFKEVECR